MTEGESQVPTPGPNEIAAKAVMDKMAGAAGMNMPPAMMAMVANAKAEAEKFERFVKDAMQVVLKNQTLTYAKLQHIESLLTEMGAKPSQ